MSFLASLALTIAPFGNVAAHLTKQPVWTGFHSDDAVLVIARAELIDTPKGSAQSRFEAAREATRGLDYGSALPPTAAAVESAWGKLSKDELKPIEKCDNFPCKVKLNREEVKVLDSLKKNRRLSAYFGLIGSRLEKYLASSARPAYEQEKQIADPWAWFDKSGSPELPPKSLEPDLNARRMHLLPEKMRPIRQILDRRTQNRKAGISWESTTWVRAVYSNHYFDDWAEWLHIVPAGDGKKTVVVHLLLVELDLMKKGGLFERMARPRMKAAVKELGRQYLEEAAAEIRNALALPGKAQAS